ncbi:hypothetical protein EXIGLDRAFT_83104 [Exidia glandulosa HHB12029]|uniref:Uncharacterized protein n=1 Tax=Exidia glandulosa HHB12029 TaxID=1314781 RepID=A0A166MGP9_EXIGL|nr:hypothetical protein EXIGLDRAFT_83104 [Exidia glandulosa HHB12029]
MCMYRYAHRPALACVTVAALGDHQPRAHRHRRSPPSPPESRPCARRHPPPSRPLFLALYKSQEPSYDVAHSISTLREPVLGPQYSLSKRARGIWVLAVPSVSSAPSSRKSPCRSRPLHRVNGRRGETTRKPWSEQPVRVAQTTLCALPRVVVCATTYRLALR